MRLSQRIFRLTRAFCTPVFLCAVSVALASCTTPGGGTSGLGDETGALNQDPNAVKVALLLPSSGPGNASQVAQALRQAGELALFDFNKPNIALIPKDTGGSAGGARAAAQEAVNEGAELIIGPLFAAEVRAVAPIAQQNGIPVIAFSTDRNVAGNGVYLLSFLADADVGRVASYAMSRGKKNFAVLIPQSAYGQVAESAFAKTVARGGGRTVVRATYSGGRSGMVSPVQQITNAIRGGQQIDALFLPAGSDELPQLAPLLASNGIASDKVQFLGTGQWDYPGVGSQQALIGGWYAAPDPKGWSRFAGRYQRTYGSTPPRIASLAYDAVSLAISLSKNPPGQRYTYAQLTRSTGFSGVDGLFRLRPDGTAERGLAILQVQPSGARVIQGAPRSFSQNQSYNAGN
ncbi:penicillin-binding protein activator [Methyloligella sp. 2.7D]|uniref:penicillin-binding protein activator n=1 Tax=unclassified Methyloligella TaxID=2625955 RepID=UPI00157D4064|nr:penicillin-binding protein activator [Methyloligella sp. GL2]QKP76151.1 penicillin-binding protein activator [Methyloligella sp. GL2]